MNVLKRLALKNLKMNKRRTISTIIGIILSTALICGTATLVTSFQKTLVQNAINETGYYHVKLESIKQSELKELENNRDIREIKNINKIGYGILEGSKNESKPYLNLYSMDEKTASELKFKLKDGRFAINKDEVVISKHIIENAGVEIKIGDKLSLNIGDRKTLDGDDLDGSNPYLEGEEEILNEKHYEFKVVRNYRKTIIFF